MWGIGASSRSIPNASQDGRAHHRVIGPNGRCVLPAGPCLALAGIGTRLAALVTMKATEVVPVSREELDVGKRTVETGRVAVRKTVSTHEEKVEVPLDHDEVDIERIAIDRVVDELPRQRYEGDVLVIPVLEEVLVVRKQWVLKEELRVRKRAVRAMHEESVALRAEHVKVERTKP